MDQAMLAHLLQQMLQGGHLTPEILSQIMNPPAGTSLSSSAGTLTQFGASGPSAQPLASSGLPSAQPLVLSPSPSGLSTAQPTMQSSSAMLPPTQSEISTLSELSPTQSGASTPSGLSSTQLGVSRTSAYPPVQPVWMLSTQPQQLTSIPASSMTTSSALSPAPAPVQSSLYSSPLPFGSPTASIPNAVVPYYSRNMLNAVTGTSFGQSTRVTTNRLASSSGLSGLVSQRLDTQRSDRSRREHANATLPRKTRGKASRKPSLTDNYQEPRVEDCITSALSTTGQPISVVNISMQGRLSFPSPETRKAHYLPNHQVFYTRQEESFYNFNQPLGLNFEFPLLPLSTTLECLLENVTERIKSGGMIQLPTYDNQPSFVSHFSLLPIQLLSFTNLGRSTSSSHTSRLQVAVIKAGAIVQDLFTTYKHQFAVKAAVSYKNYLIINYAIKFHRENPTIVNISLVEFGLGQESIRRAHKCLSIRTYATFREDHDALLPEGYQQLFLEEDQNGNFIDNLCEEEECIIDEESNDKVDEEEVQISLLPNAHAIHNLREGEASLSSYNDNTSIISGQAEVSSRASLISSEIMISNSNLPYGGKKLWASIWNLPAQRRSTFYTINRVTTFYAESKRAFDRNHSDGVPPSLRLSGTSVEELSTKYLEEVRIAFRAQDFTLLLAQDRHFIILRNSHYLSSGDGIETEVIYGAFKQYTSEYARWFSPSFGDFATVATSAASSDEHVSLERLEDLSVMGAVVALNLIHGCPPLPLNPLLILCLIYDGDTGCFTKDTVSEWFLDLRYLLTTWLDLTHEDSIDCADFRTHLIIYLDMQIEMLTRRDSETHRIMAYKMLHHAILGKLGVESPEMQAFLKGFKLPVPGGLTFCEIARSYLRGGNGFISQVYKLVESFNDLQLRLIVDESELNVIDKSHLSDAFELAPDPYGNQTFRDVLRDFFEGKGIPSPAQFELIKGRINPKVSFEEVDSASFRLRSFIWAATGAPFLPPGDKKISIFELER